MKLELYGGLYFLQCGGKMVNKFLIKISDDYVNDIKEYDRIRIDDEGIVWYEFSYDNGRLGEEEPVGIMKEIK